MTERLLCHVTVTGEAGKISRLKTAAEGGAGIPWHYPDLAALDEERLARLVAPPDGSAGLDLSDAKVLTRLLRSAVETHHNQVLTAAKISHACPFSLHRLLPVPEDVLRLGPDDPISRTWLRTHWGTEQALRQVRLRPGPPSRQLRRGARISYDFWCTGGPPVAAIEHLRGLWPDLVFALRSDPAPDLIAPDLSND
jgi:hypothetical protein